MHFPVKCSYLFRFFTEAHFFTIIIKTYTFWEGFVGWSKKGTTMFKKVPFSSVIFLLVIVLFPPLPNLLLLLLFLYFAPFFSRAGYLLLNLGLRFRGWRRSLFLSWCLFGFFGRFEIFLLVLRLGLTTSFFTFLFRSRIFVRFGFGLEVFITGIVVRGFLFVRFTFSALFDRSFFFIFFLRLFFDVNFFLTLVILRPLRLVHRLLLDLFLHLFTFFSFSSFSFFSLTSFLFSFLSFLFFLFLSDSSFLLCFWTLSKSHFL